MSYGYMRHLLVFPLLMKKPSTNAGFKRLDFISPVFTHFYCIYFNLSRHLCLPYILSSLKFLF